MGCNPKRLTYFKERSPKDVERVKREIIEHEKEVDFSISGVFTSFKYTKGNK